MNIIKSFLVSVLLFNISLTSIEAIESAPEAAACHRLHSHEDVWNCLYDILLNKGRVNSFEFVQAMCRAKAECYISQVFCASRSAQPSTPYNPRAIIACKGHWIGITKDGEQLEYLQCNNPDDFECNFDKFDTFSPSVFNFTDIGPDYTHAREAVFAREEALADNRCSKCHNSYSGDRSELAEGVQNLPAIDLLKLREIDPAKSGGECKYDVRSPLKCDDPNPEPGSLKEFYCALRGIETGNCYEPTGDAIIESVEESAEAPEPSAPVEGTNEPSSPTGDPYSAPNASNEESYEQTYSMESGYIPEY